MSLQPSTAVQVAPQAPHSATLDLKRLRHTLAPCAVGHTIHAYASVPSTMSLAHQLVRNANSSLSGRGNVSGTLVVTEEQTAGRGRHQRTWHAPPATALLLSIILQPPHLPAEATLLPMLAGIGIIQTLSLAFPPLMDSIGLKWPNDVILATNPHGAAAYDWAQPKTHYHKLAGILVESTLRGHTVDYAILGLGINVNQSRDQLPPPTSGAASALPATSLRIALNASIDRTDLLIHLCQTLSHLVATATEQTIFAEWRSHLVTLGREVTITQPESNDPPLVGTALNVTPTGDLIVQDNNGYQHTISAGDVSLRHSP